jgi:Domain of unknown function (DUF4136)
MISRITSLLFILILTGCLQQPDLKKLSGDMAVSTNYDENTTFGQFQTFYLRADTIGLVSNRDSRTAITDADASIVLPVIQEAVNQMTDHGYTRVNKTDQPDLGVYIFLLDDFNAFQQLVYPNSYYGGYSYYGYYYPYVQTSYSQFATLVVQVVDLKKFTGPNVVWTVYIGDLYASQDAVGKSVEAIGQAFAQSGYLMRN